MPIATCVLESGLNATSPHDENVVELWSRYANVSSNEMSVSFINSSASFGKSYALQASLILPSLWSKAEMNQLQLGLSRGLADYFSIDPSSIIVTTTIVASGLVVENDKQVNW